MTRQPGIRDNTDRQLLALLQTNARQSTMTLAKRLGMARSTVHERIRRLERDGVIRGYSVRLGTDPTRDWAMAVAMLTIEQRRQREILDAMRRLPEVELCGTTPGNFDLIVIVKAPTLADVDALIDELLIIRGVHRCQSAPFMAMLIDRRSNGE